MEDFNVCMECGKEWEQNNAERCPRCGCSDIYVDEDVMEYEKMEGNYGEVNRCFMDFNK